jgi:hypothetical protein
MGDYVVVTTTDSEDSGPRKHGAINGGFYPKKDDWPAQYPSVVIAVDDIEVAMGKVSDAGGKVLGTPMEIPGSGSTSRSRIRKATASACSNRSRRWTSGPSHNSESISQR